MNYGYARVSSKEQNEQRQMIVLTAFGIVEKNIYMDKQSGKLLFIKPPCVILK